MAQPARCFKYIVEALEAETLQGQTAARVVNAAKQLATVANLSLGQLATSLTAEQQQVVQAYFG